MGGGVGSFTSVQLIFCYDEDGGRHFSVNYSYLILNLLGHLREETTVLTACGPTMYVSIALGLKLVVKVLPVRAQETF